MCSPGFLRLWLCFISSFIQSQCFFAIFHLWSHYLLTHLSSSKWFLFIFGKSSNQSWKLNAIQRSHCFQPHSLSLWKWMAAAENSDVLSHPDGFLLMFPMIFTVAAFWLKAYVGDLTNHVTHLTYYIISAMFPPFFHLLCLTLTVRVAHRDH